MSLNELLNNGDLVKPWCNLVIHDCTVDGNCIIDGDISLAGGIVIAGNIVPSIALTDDLGSVALPWREVYAGGATLSAMPNANIAQAGGSLIKSNAGVLTTCSASYSSSNNSVVVRGDAGDIKAGAAAFTGCTISALPAFPLTTSGSAIVSNSGVLSTSPVDVAATASTIVLRDAGGGIVSGPATFTTLTVTSMPPLSITTSGSLVSSNAGVLSTTTVNAANSNSTIVLRGTAGQVSCGAITATGANITALPPLAITTSGSLVSSNSGVLSTTPVDVANTNSTVVLRGAAGQLACGAITATGATISALPSFPLTNSGLVIISNAGTLGTSAADSANTAGAIVLRGGSGQFSAGAVNFTSADCGVLTASGATITALPSFPLTTSGSAVVSNSGILSTTVVNASSVASTIVLRDVSAGINCAALAATTITASGLLAFPLTTTGSVIVSNSGTLATTTANVANSNSTLLLRGAAGEVNGGAASFSGCTISALPALAITTTGSAVTSNAGVLSTTTINAANSNSTIVLRGTSGQIVGGSGSFSSVNLSDATNQMVLGTTNTTTFSAPAPASPITLTFPNTADTIVGRATTDTLTNKTITAAALSGTFTGSPAFSGNPTFTNTGTSIACTGDITQKRYYGEWQNSVAQTLADSTDTTIQFNTVVGSLTNVPALTATNTKLTPTKAGYYLIVYQVPYTNNSTGFRVTYIRFNGNGTVRYGMQAAQATNGVDMTQNGTAIFNFNGSTDYFEVFGYQTSGGNLTVGGTVGSSGSICRLSVSFLHE